MVLILIQQQFPKYQTQGLLLSRPGKTVPQLSIKGDSAAETAEDNFWVKSSAVSKAAKKGTWDT